MTEIGAAFTYLLFANGIFSTIILVVLFNILVEVKKGNKDQQEIKTRLTGSRKRELKMADKIQKFDVRRLNIRARDLIRLDGNNSSRVQGAGKTAKKSKNKSVRKAR